MFQTMNKQNGDEVTLSIGINGFGRIGRMLARVIFETPGIVVTAINDPFMTPEYMAYLLTHDSVHGRMKMSAEAKGDTLVVNGDIFIQVFSFKEANLIPWGACAVNTVAECSGHYRTSLTAEEHLHSGAKRVILSAPPKDNVTPMIVMGVNHTSFKPFMRVVSNASCTTNCLAPLAKVIETNFGIVEGIMTTIHSMTASQSVVDCPSGRDWRAGRCAGLNIIPATTGAADAIGKVIPQLKGKLTGMAFRVPTNNVSVVDLTCKLHNPISSIQDIATAVANASKDTAGGLVIGVTYEPVVSMDFNGDSRSCILDATACIMLNSTFVKLVAYYDNEWAYAVRMADLMLYIYNHEESKEK
eukprot:gene27030-35739_t